MENPYQSPSAAQHREQSPDSVRCAVITVSDTRNLESDTSGQAIVAALEEAGHTIADRSIVPDEVSQLQKLVGQLADLEDVQAILVTGGTGIAARDQTPDAIASMYTKVLPGYGELLRMLSYQEIGSAAMLSRASGGLVGDTLVLTMPGSTGAVRLAMEKLILPEIGHLVSLAQG